MAPRHSSMASIRVSHASYPGQPGAPGGGPPLGSGLSPAQLGWREWFRSSAGKVTVDTTSLVSWTGQIAGYTLSSIAPDYPQIDGTKVRFDGASQFLQSTDAALLALVNSDDEAYSIAFSGRVIGLTPRGRVLGWCRNTGDTHCGMSISAAATGYRIQRGTSVVEGGTLSVDRHAWFCTQSGVPNEISNEDGSVLSGDLSAVGAQTITHFVVGAGVITGTVWNRFLEVEIEEIAIKAGVITADEKTQLAAYWGA